MLLDVPPNLQELGVFLDVLPKLLMKPDVWEDMDGPGSCAR